MKPNSTRIVSNQRLAGLSGLELTVLGLFFLSGASALVYEVVWSRELTYVFGGSAFAIATVLAAYMAGLALGSTVFGRSIDRRGHPLVVYGILEGAIALWALLLPFLLDGLNHLYAGLYRSLDPGFYTLSLIRFALCFLLLLVPTTMMGGTLPVLGKLLLRDPRGLGRRAGLLYGANTLGAVLGTAAGGFLLMPALGLTGATWVAVAFNLAVAAAAVLTARRFPYASPAKTATADPARTAADEDAHRDRLRRVVLVVYAASGFAALAYEVAWTKTLSLVLGTTTYAFTSMLTTFLLGLALGALIFGRLADRRGRPEGLLALVQLGIPLLALLTIPLLERLPQMFVDGFPRLRHSWAALELYRIALAGAVMFLPTLLMGGTFPLVTRAYMDRRETGKSLGSLYAANTVGAILGSFLTGFVLLPWIGRQNSILAASFVNLAAAVGLLIVLRGRTLTRGMRWGVAVLVLLLVPAWILGLKPWNPKLMASGAYVYAEAMAEKESIEQSLAGVNVLFHHEGPEATVSVWQEQYNMALRVSGKVDASSHGDMVTQKLISHLPALYHQGEAKEGLMIGLASGISSGTLLVYPLDRLETVEIVAGMDRAARFFDSFNFQVLDDPRHRLIFNDGRNHLLLTDRTYDILISEPPNPWIAGIGSLFTREFFELTKAHLRPGGVVCQWVQTYQFQESDLKTVISTFVDAYPYIHLWQGRHGDLILVSSLEPLRMDLARLRAMMDEPAGRDLADLEILPLGQLLSYFVTDRDGLARYVEGWPDRVTDDNLYLEYAVPRHMYETKYRVSALTLEPYRISPLEFIEGAPRDSTLRADLERFRQARAISLPLALGDDLPPGLPTRREALLAALEIAPEEALARHLYGHDVNEAALAQLLAGDAGRARALFRTAAVWGDRGERALALNNLGALAFNAGERDSAESFWRSALEQEPTFTTARFNLSLIYGAENRPQEVVQLLREVVKVETSNAAAWNNLAYNLVRGGGDLEEAERAARRAADLEPTAINFDTLALVLIHRDRLQEAEKLLERALDENPDLVTAILHLGMVQARTGRPGPAREAFERVIQRNDNEEAVREAREELLKL